MSLALWPLLVSFAAVLVAFGASIWRSERADAEHFNQLARQHDEHERGGIG